MTVLTEIVKNVLVIIIMASFLELLLPDGKVKPFVRFAIGLFILIAVLNPSLSFLFNSNHNFQINFWDYCADMDQGDEIMENGRDIKDQLIKSNNDMVKKKLEGQINAVAMLVPGVQSVNTRAQMTEEGMLEKLYLMIRTEEGDKSEKDSNIKVFSAGKEGLSDEEQQQMETKIKSVVRNLYGFENIDIEIEFEGG